MNEVYRAFISLSVPLGVIALLYCLTAQFGFRLIEFFFLLYFGSYLVASIQPDLSSVPFVPSPTTDFLVRLWVWVWSIGGLICGTLLFHQRFRQLRRC